MNKKQLKNGEEISLYILKPNMRGMQYGIGTYIAQLLNAFMVYANVNIYIINYLSDNYKELKVESLRHNITEIFIPEPVNNKQTKNKLNRYSNQIIYCLTPFLLNNPNQIVLVNYPDAIYLVKQLKLKFNLKIISVIHSAQYHFMFHGNKNRFIQNWFSNSTSEDIHKWSEDEHELYKLSDRIVSVTHYMKKFLIEYYKIIPDKIEVIKNGIDISRLKILNKGDKILLKRTLGFYQNEKIVLFSGRLDASKGLYFLIDGFNEVAKRDKNVRLVIIGGDSPSDRIGQYLQHCQNSWGRVTFTGFLEHEKAIEFYQIANIGVIPSIYDHCPYVALEMIAHNIPVILSNVEGLDEILDETQSVYLNPHIDDKGKVVFDVKEIANAIITLLDDEQKSMQIIQDYQQLIQTKFSSQRMAVEMYCLFKVLLKD